VQSRTEPAGPSSNNFGVPPSDLLLRETNHRCSNDLQLIVSLLSLQSRRLESQEARIALDETAKRVAVLARARAAIAQQRTPDLSVALQQVCEALQPHAEARSILLSLQVDEEPTGLSADAITTLALVVNELMTNAIKHAFAEGVSGRIAVKVERSLGTDVVVTVDDDGLPYPDAPAQAGGGLGLDIAKRLMASIDGLLIVPTGPAKVFELRVPTGNARRSA